MTDEQIEHLVDRTFKISAELDRLLDAIENPGDAAIDEQHAKEVVSSYLAELKQYASDIVYNLNRIQTNVIQESARLADKISGKNISNEELVQAGQRRTALEDRFECYGGNIALYEAQKSATDLLGAYIDESTMQSIEDISKKLYSLTAQVHMGLNELTGIIKQGWDSIQLQNKSGRNFQEFNPLRRHEPQGRRNASPGYNVNEDID